MWLLPFCGSSRGNTNKGWTQSEIVRQDTPSCEVVNLIFLLYKRRIKTIPLLVWHRGCENPSILFSTYSAYFLTTAVCCEGLRIQTWLRKVPAHEEVEAWVLKQIIQSLDVRWWITLASFGYTGQEFGSGATCLGLNPGCAFGWVIEHIFFHSVKWDF